MTPAGPKLLRHRIQCLSCGEIIESRWGHDFRFCHCRKIYVDGGLSCPRIGWSGPFRDMSEYEEPLTPQEEVLALRRT